MTNQTGVLLVLVRISIIGHLVINNNKSDWCVISGGENINNRSLSKKLTNQTSVLVVVI